MLKQFIYFIILFSSLTSAQVDNQLYKHPEWSYNKSIYEANIRQFSEEGTFDKFREYIPELKKMGIGIIWLMPINPIGEKNRKGTLGSYYSVKDYLDVNPEFGSKEDFKELVDEIHNYGMYVIIDWIANHTSWDNYLTVEHPDFYNLDSLGNFILPDTNWTDVIDLNYNNPALHNYMTEALLYWVNEFDIDGYRCDVAEMVPMDFWRDARTELEKYKPVFMLAEGEQPYLHEAFDMTYSWDTYKIMKDIASGKKSAASLNDYLLNEWKRYPENAFRMRFTTNHDENSWSGTDYEMFGEGAGTFTALSILIPGMPLVYTGQETGSDKRLQFFEKDVIEFKDEKMREIYSLLLNLKKENPALLNGEKSGEYIPVPVIDSSKTLSFIRVSGNYKVFCVFNLSGENKRAAGRSEYLNGKYTDLFSSEDISFNYFYEFNLLPWEYKILIKK